MPEAPVRIDLRADPDAKLDVAVAHLRAGGVVAYPTETVYGFGSLPTAAGIARLRALKHRTPEKPFIVLVRSAEEIDALTWTDEARELASIFWPGAVTLVLEDPRGIFPPGIRSETATVAVRMSPQPIVLRLLGELDAPLISTSLNLPGDPPARSGREAAEVIRRVGDFEVVLLDAGTLPESGPSTIIDCTGKTPGVLREGAVPLGRLRCVIPEIHGRHS